ncbi:MAG TPA: PKD domain-containing protein [Methanocella sp.]|nr:PKD domain-containing protein [Methanocella sp.]
MIFMAFQATADVIGNLKPPTDMYINPGNYIILKPSLYMDAAVNPTTVNKDTPSTITVTVKDVNGTKMGNVMVKLSLSGGTVKENAGFTNSQGVFTTTFQSPLAGIFNINITASKDGFWDATRSVQVTIPNTPPTAGFTANPKNGPEPLNVTFDASASKDIDGSIVAYAWDFGDGKNGTGQNVVHNYTVNGTYAAVLTVTDNLGATNTYSSQIIVAANKTTGGGGFDLGGLGTTVIIALVLAALVILLALVVFLYLWLKSTLRIAPKVTKIPADGKAVVPVKVMFVNGLGMVKKQRSDVEVEITSTAGKIQNVIIPTGRDFVEAPLTSSEEFGPVAITARAKGKTARAEVRFAYDKAVIDLAVSPDSIPADSKSSANVTIKIKDSSGKFIVPLEEMTVDLKSTLGAIKTPVKLLPRAQSATASITSGEVSGTAVISAVMGDLRGEGKINFQGIPKRFCMHCGTPMEMEAPSCPKCGLTPPSGVDAKQCSTCDTVIPEPAKFCYKCGARQPEMAKPQPSQEQVKK